MRHKKNTSPLSPADVSLEQLEGELRRVQDRQTRTAMLRYVLMALMVAAAAAVLVATLLMPVLQIYGSSMTDTLHDGDLVVSVKGADCERGDVVAFYYNNKILVKRVIAFGGDWVDIDEDGNVYVNGELLDEPYVTDKAFGDCNIELPYQVPEDRLFLMGDHRAASVDSRNTAVGCVAEEQIVGRLVFRVWPLDSIGSVE